MLECGSQGLILISCPSPPSAVRATLPSAQLLTHSPLALSSGQGPPTQTQFLPIPASYRGHPIVSLLPLAPLRFPLARSSPCSGDNRAHRCTWRRVSGCIFCSSCPLLGCTPEGRGEKWRGGLAPSHSILSLPGAHARVPGPDGSPPGSLTCTDPQSHSSPASTKPFPHSGGSRSWRERGCREPGWDPAHPLLPGSLR